MGVRGDVGLALGAHDGLVLGLTHQSGLWLSGGHVGSSGLDVDIGQFAHDLAHGHFLLDAQLRLILDVRLIHNLMILFNRVLSIVYNIFSYPLLPEVFQP